ncbi:MAG TPA: DHA2 family efflux MFS transporter permease subunit [Gordonia sp. (in: high G+C Gram-positive bacteria)]|uniref:DHA2 family efflux MFS transporter permease subunit n=1 Tax=unclassified Gordonia (in: high G+C Gram-positive bacteria) TaxID=2657482 RepID=UPI0025C4754E|nr:MULTISPECIES: DHA2 family efflux MFS transporter permease subunit [unclassified Gordonia (in: high G+C Gram-positive bacteria)]HNP58948.1 DHA2 family efflux MFS transporter permease subunit [Gordonia sp. (in: high G+C Gram-positive bacteria)]HRC52503.1 DHA2 family efflux MFS transporter permease subunit [Gordonia sp. (in: high G+C Gram-positive bacteria)]
MAYSATPDGGPDGTYSKVFGPQILVISGMQLLMVLDGTVAALALPRISKSMHLDTATGNWIITAYVLAFGGLMLLGGRLGDTYGRKKVFILGVLAFTVSSLLCGLALNPEMLIAFRALQGASAAIAAPTAMALVATTFAPGQDRSRAFAIYAAMTGIGSVAGLILGGVLTEVGWRLVFLINVPIGFAVAVGAWAFLKESQGARLRLDVPGALLATLGCTLIVFGVNAGPGSGWASPLVIGTLIGGIAVLIAFVLIERNADHPILPFSIFDNSSRVAALIAILFASAIMMCMAVFISLYLQWILVYQPWQSGLAVVPFAFGFGIAAAIASNLSLRMQPRWLVILGGAIIFLGCLYASSMANSDPAYFPKIFVPVLVIGFGVGLAVVPLTLAVVAGVGATEIGPLTAVAQVAQQLGGAVGLVAVGAFATSRTLSMGGVAEPAKNITPGQIDALASGYGLAFAACAGIAILAGVVVLFMRFTPEEVAEGQAATEEEHSGTGPMNLQGPAGS